MKLAKNLAFFSWALVVLIGMMSLSPTGKFAEAGLSMCDGCQKFEKRDSHRKVGKGRHRSREVMCPAGWLLHDVDCHKSSSKFSVTKQFVVSKVENGLPRYGYFCEIKSNRVRVSCTQTTSVSCYPPPPGTPKVATISTSGHGRKTVTTSHCPSGQIMTASHCHSTNTGYSQISNNANHKSVSGFPVDRLPSSVECQFQSNGHSSRLTAVAYCRNPHSSMKLNTAELVQRPVYRNDESATIDVNCPNGKKHFASKCHTNLGRHGIAFQKELGEKGVQCGFSKGGTNDVVSALVYCVDDSASI